MRKTPHPPRYLLRFLRWFCDPDLHIYIEGDLLELYRERVEEMGQKKADRRLAWDVFLLFRPGIIRNIQLPNYQNAIDMLKHNLLISLRGFMKDKATFLINLLGFSTGLACVFFIYLWVNDELKIDQFHENKEQLYHVMQIYPMAGKNELLAPSPAPLAKDMEAHIPEVEKAISMTEGSYFEGLLLYEDKGIKARPRYADNGYFQMFSYPLLQGRKGHVLRDKYDAVISQELAFKLFDSAEEAIGKTFEWKKKVGNIVDFSHPSFKITGVFDNMKARSSEEYDVIFTYDFFDSLGNPPQDWDNDSAATFAILRDGANADSVSAKVTALVSAKRSWENQFVLKKFASKYLHNVYESGADAGGRIEYVRLFSVIAILILLIAAINFINLFTAKASTRVKEIGIKKTLGSSRAKLIGQFVTESLLITFAAFLIALTMTMVLLPQFNQITGKALAINWSAPEVAILFGIAAAMGLISSIYPALYLSSYRPIQVLKSNIHVSFGEVWARKGLVIFQFSISIIMITAVLVIYHQMKFIHSKNLGYERHNILTLENDPNLEEKMVPFLSEVRDLPQVVNVTSSTGLIGNDSWTGNIDWEGKEGAFILDVFQVKPGFIETFGLKLKEGQQFPREQKGLITPVIVNESAVRDMGLENPIGRSITFWGAPAEIIGVVKDFQYKSLYNRVGPCIFRLLPEDLPGNQIAIKLVPGQERQANTQIGGLYEKFNPGIPFEYSFVDEEFEALYASENRTAALSKYFAGLAILISCLGLFGLTTFSTERRQKEIGIRKILGSNTIALVWLLSKEFTLSIAIAILIGVPVSYLLASHWLNSFAYKIDLQWWLFLLIALALLSIAWLIMGVKTVRTARANPVECLRED